jgi:hypothetical protein
MDQPKKKKVTPPPSPICEGVVQPAKKKRVCSGCTENQPNQIAHYGGCMPDVYAGETWDDLLNLEK